ncbi:MAG: hypothetical protein KG029_05535 [Bacteroidetes bacterium]|jgi:hypothetical protein|nr:hypothetical protein [Bacteroidota bacterium]
MKNKAKTRSKKRTQRRARSERLKQNQSRIVLLKGNSSDFADEVQELIQVREISIDSLKLTQLLMEDDYYKALSERAFVQVAYIELNSQLHYSGSRQFDVLSARRHAHQKILLGKWLKYGLFYNLAWFTFRDLGKPSQGVSPPVDYTLQAA